MRLSSGGELLELPATHSLGMLGRGLASLDGLVHLHFHDWELVDRRRSLALVGVLRLLRLRRRPLTVAELAASSLWRADPRLARGYDRPVKAPRPAEDVRASRPYLLSSSPFKTLLRRLGSIAALVAIDICGLLIGLYGALALRALVVDPKPILWGLLWDQETRWLPFSSFCSCSSSGGPVCTRRASCVKAPAGSCPSVFLVAVLALAFAIGTGQHFTTFGLYIVGAISRRGLHRCVPRELRAVHRVGHGRRGRAPQGGSGR